MTAELKEINLKEPLQGTIDGLEELLKDARTGEIRSLIGVMAFHDGSVSEFWLGMDARAPTRALVGQIEELKFKLFNRESE